MKIIPFPTMYINKIVIVVVILYTVLYINVVQLF